MSEAHLFAIGIVLAWLAGVRVYLTVFGVGVAGWFGWLDLPPALAVAQSPWVMGVSAVLAAADGTSPTPAVARPIRVMVTRKVVFRPSRSPI